MSNIQGCLTPPARSPNFFWVGLIHEALEAIPLNRMLL